MAYRFTVGANGDIFFSTKEDFEAAIAAVDIIIDETFAFSPLDYTIADVTSVLGNTSAAFQQDSIWRIDGLISPSNGYDWFESTFPQADAVLQVPGKKLGSEFDLLKVEGVG